MLQFRNLRAGYDRLERLHTVNAACLPGQLTAVIGPNGCGKSTLLKCAAGLLTPFSGEILLNSTPLRSLSEKERAKKISYMPQSRLTPELTVQQLVQHGRYPHLNWGQRLQAEDMQMVNDALLRTNLCALANRPISELSGGERQRAYLAMMLAQQTDVMLLDEPTTYLDLSAQFAMMDLLQALCREGRSALVVLHDLALALEYADHVLLMQNGSLIAEGAPEEIYAGGLLQKVFGVEAVRLPDGKYLFSSLNQEK